MLNAEPRVLKFVASIWHLIDAKTRVAGLHLALLPFAVQIFQIQFN